MLVQLTGRDIEVVTLCWWIDFVLTYKASGFQISEYVACVCGCVCVYVCVYVRISCVRMKVEDKNPLCLLQYPFVSFL